ncbi:Putative flippase GtrA (transmembrane translocase of bactoprenol-linked glucose) [Filimonas lacunae]|uniref:Putative flippase GtrA (Transmembrane translocase of bactoprenol-linked glucose) n=1 Tax=Filimonas lacunae TaxID=477680 RepID=A0A1N7KG18_9BACT|nr:Putative flippase GtrA (transmembrane translocase of bactoprenol-linked glucose) [Filimonas lacunae]
MFIKAQLTSLSASLIDNATAIVLQAACKVPKLYAGMAGVVIGGIFHFSVSRRWVFNASDKSRKDQIIKYIMVWSGNFFLNTAGIAILLRLTHLDFKIIKVLVSIVVGITYNYFLQKRFVFK